MVRPSWQRRAHRPAAGDFNQLLHPPDSRDQRIVPFFEKHSEAHRKARCRRCDYIEAGLKTIGDIGGGRGHLLYAVLERVPDARGVLFELPTVIEHARQRGHARVTYVGERTG